MIIEQAKLTLEQIDADVSNCDDNSETFLLKRRVFLLERQQLFRDKKLNTRFCRLSAKLPWRQLQNLKHQCARQIALKGRASPAERQSRAQV